MVWLLRKQFFKCVVLGPGDGMDSVQAQQQLMDAGVAVDGGGGVEMMVMESLDPALLQMKTEVNDSSDVCDRTEVLFLLDIMLAMDPG